MLVSFAEEKTGECVVCCHRCGAFLMESASTTSYMVCPECGARLVVWVKKGKVSVFGDDRSEEELAAKIHIAGKSAISNYENNSRGVQADSDSWGVECKSFSKSLTTVLAKFDSYWTKIQIAWKSKWILQLSVSSGSDLFLDSITETYKKIALADSKAKGQRIYFHKIRPLNSLYCSHFQKWKILLILKVKDIIFSKVEYHF